ncbi:glycosyl hydrolase family protein [Penicillium longicatenatum]|uniref:glycosyl hydrolase family protein n=1 Tax=Penicillium longicatenatum TaxID=1561947 RepID=UPI0025476A09|nr:glycosyl hydrolase family protein [Penicillium longicatenatum]KAJ5636512.1 glycosyl hydrolase family protein [Penicillium longicatenatum]
MPLEAGVISTLIRSPSPTRATKQVANWIGRGPGFYAALGFNGLLRDERTIVAWMNNWRLALKTINGTTAMIQEPTGKWKALVIELTFSNREPSSTAKAEFKIAVAASKDYSHETRVGYHFSIQPDVIGQTQSGDVSFDADVTVFLRVFVDWSSVDVFGGHGEASQTFPSKDAVDSRLYSTGGETRNVKLRVREVRSTL